MDDRWTSPDGGPSPSESGRETDAEPAADERKGPYTIPKAAPGSRPPEGRLFDSSGLPNPGAPAGGEGTAQEAGGGAAAAGGPEQPAGGAADSPAPSAPFPASSAAEDGSGAAPYTPSTGSGAPQDSANRSFTTSGSGDSDDTAAFGEVSGTPSGAAAASSDSDRAGPSFGGSDFGGSDFGGSDFGGSDSGRSDFSSADSDSSDSSGSGADSGSAGGFAPESPWSGTSGGDPYSGSSSSPAAEDSAASRPWEQSPSGSFGSGADYASGSAADPAWGSGTGGSRSFADSPGSAPFAGSGSDAPLSGGNESFRGADSTDYGSAASGDRYGSGSPLGQGWGAEQGSRGSGADSPGWDAQSDRHGAYGAAAEGYGSGSQAADPYGADSASGGSASLYGAAGAAGAAAYGAADSSAPYGTPSHGSPAYGGSYGSADSGSTPSEAPGSRPWETGQQPSAGYSAGSSGSDAPPSDAGAAGSDSTSVLPSVGQDTPGQGGAESAASPAEAPYDPYGPYGPYGGRPAPSGPQQPYGAAPSGPQQPYGAAPSGPQAGAAAGGYGPGGPYGEAGPGGPQPPSDPYAEGYGDEAPRKKSRKGLFIGIGAVALVLVLAGGVTGWYLFGRGPGPDETAATFAAAWNEQDAEAMAAAASGNPADVLDPIVDNLGVEATAIEVGEVTEGEDQTASAPFTATLSLKNAGDWTYESTMDLVREDGEWKVDFSPATVHPELSEGSTLVRGNVWGDRGRILAADGSPIDTQDTSESVQMLAGSVGTATEEDLERLGPAYAEGDPAGTSGLQATYEERLAGKASISIRVAEEGSEEEVAADPEAPALETLEGEPGRDVTTTIDPAMQGAAASAVSGASKPTALVAVRPSTGEVVASANNTPGFNRAFEGQYAPGSAFKIVTYEALLENGLTTDATMDCPKEAMGFTNAGDAKYGKQTVTEAFATSCNTALVQDVANRLDGSTMTAAAEMFGMNQELKVGVPTHEPSFPTPDSTGMLAAQSIGQGQILTTPLHMATLPAAVADGSWRAPTLVSDPEPKDLPEPTAVPHAETLRPMMRAVITDGTAEDAGFKGEVFGKTGSAEFGTAENEDDELDTHAWMVGYKGDIAFAVIVEGGGGGGSVAGPIGAKFTNGL